MLAISPLCYSAYGAKDLDLVLLCAKKNLNDDLFTNNTSINKKYFDSFPLGLVFKGKKVHDVRLVLDENERVLIKKTITYKYTVYVDNISLSQKNGTERLLLNKGTFALTNEDETININCEEKNSNELQNILEDFRDKIQKRISA